jgi:CTP-dependent riboflavin kinase
MKLLTGIIEGGSGGASPRTSEVIDELRELTGFRELRSGTLNVRLKEPHTFREDFCFTRDKRREPDPKEEDWFFEVCRVSRAGRSTKALILRTSRNFHGDCVLEVMAEEKLRDWLPANDSDSVQVEIYETSDEVSL